MQDGPSPSPSSRPPRRGGATANARMFASIQSTLRSGKEFRDQPAARQERPHRRREQRAVKVLKSVDEVIEQLADLERRGEHSTSQIKANLEASATTLEEMWDDDWMKLVDELIKMCLESDEAVFVVDLLPIFMKYSDFVDAFREKMIGVSSEFVLPSEEKEEEGRGAARYEQVPAFLGSLLCARWPRGMHRDTAESNPLLFTAFEIVRGWMLVVEEANPVGEKRETRIVKEEIGQDEGEEEAGEDDVEAVTNALQENFKINGEKEEKGREEVEKDQDSPPEASQSREESIVLLNRCCSGLAAICESQQRSLWLSRPELVDDMYKCIKLAITHNRDIDGSVKSALLHTYLLMNEWTRSKAVTMKTATTQTVANQ